MLDCYLKGFISRNGFHLNGDYKKLGMSWCDYRPFTLEGNFAAAQAVHEMLLQSWGGIVRVFPATPDEWRDVGFDNWRAEGGLRISAQRRAGRTVRVAVAADTGGQVRLRRTPLPSDMTWTRSDLVTDGEDLVCHMEPGESLEGTAL